MEVKVIGQMDNTIDHTFESANRVYDVGGCCPTINTCGGGGLQPKILEDAQAIRMVRTEEGKALRKEYESGAIHHGFNEHREMELRTDGVSNTLSTVQKDNYICEKSIVAMRGRNPDNPSDRRTGIETEQVLEIKEDVVTNTLTSVQKDNLLLEQVAIIDDIYHSRDERVYTEVSPALRAERGGLKVIKIQEEVLDELKDWVWEVDGQVSPTLMAGEQDICRIEKEPCVVQKCGDRDKDGKYSIHSYSNCTPANPMSDRGQFLLEPQYRIRKLTPRECWRLMDFTDEDFEKAAQVNSNTQLYKQAGNSIVKNVLCEVFKQLIGE